MKFRTTMLIGAGLVTAVAMAATQGVLLRHNFATDMQDVYKVDMTMKQKISIPSMGDQDLDMKGSMKYALKYGASDSATGKSDLTMNISDMKFDLTGPMAEMANMGDQLPKEMKLKAKIDGRNRVSDLKAEGANMQMMMMSGAGSMMSSLFIEFPEKEVAVGDTWDVKIPKNAMTGNEETILKATLVSEKEVDGKKIWVLGMTGKIPTKLDMAELMKGQPDPSGGAMAGMEMVITGTTDLKAEAQVDKATGKTLVITTTMKMKNQMEMKSMGMTLDMNGDMTTKMSLVK